MLVVARDLDLFANDIVPAFEPCRAPRLAAPPEFAGYMVVILFDDVEDRNDAVIVAAIV